VVAARHHYGIRSADDFIEAIDRRRLFELGHYQGLVADDGAGLEDILGSLDERQRNPVDSQLKRVLQILPILLRQRRNRQQQARYIHALAIGQTAADDDPREGKIAAEFLDAQFELAIVEQQGCTVNQGG
jgi:hypothetical protein